MKLTSTEIFKNINFPEIQEYKDALFFDFSASNCDFNGAVFLACSFKNCIFRNCNLSNCRFFSNVIFDGCIFEYCDFRSVGLLGTKFEKCFFEKCDMRGLNLDSAKWTKCEIKNCNFRDISLHSWNWIECKFSGTLREIKFLGKNNSKFFLDFSDCKLDCVEFFDCDISKCIPPKNKKHHFINNLSVYIEKSEFVVKDMPEDVKKIIERRLKKLRGMRQYIFNVESLKKIEDKMVVDALLEIFDLF